MVEEAESGSGVPSPRDEPLEPATMAPEVGLDQLHGKVLFYLLVRDILDGYDWVILCKDDQGGDSQISNLFPDVVGLEQSVDVGVFYDWNSQVLVVLE